MLPILALAAVACAMFPARSAASIEAASASSPLNGLHISGNRFVDDNGMPVTLRGVFYTSFEWSCINGGLLVGAPLTVSAIQALLSWHINAVRITVPEDCWLGINGAPSGGTVAAYQQELMTWINLLHSYGIYTEIGLIYAAPGTNVSNAQAPMPDEDHSVAFWSSFASYFKDEPDTILGLYGEPHPDATATVNPWACWRGGGSSCNVTYNGVPYTAAGMQQLVNTIRATGSTLPISISGIHWAEDFSNWLEYEPSDPLNQLAAEWHQYSDVPCFGTGDVMEANNESCWDDAVLRVVDAVPMLNGEVGEYAHSNTCAWQFVPTYLAWAEAHHVSYMAWRWGPTSQCVNMALNQDYNGTPTPVYGQGYQAWLAQVTAAPPGSTAASGSPSTASSGQGCAPAIVFARVPRTAMVGAFIRYGVTVSNTGSGNCPAAQLDVWSDPATRPGANTTLTLDDSQQGRAATCHPPAVSGDHENCLVLTVGALSAGQSILYSFHASQAVIFSHGDVGTASVHAEMATGGESVSVTTKRVLVGITSTEGSVNSRGSGKMRFACDDPRGDPCHVTGLVEEHVASSRVTRAFLSRSPTQPPGRAHGLVRGGHKGRIAITLSRAERRSMLKHRRVSVLLVLTVTDKTGQVSTLAYPVMFSATG